VQAEGAVPATPLVAGPAVLVHDDRRHAELAQPGAERDAGLAAADDEHLGLGGVAELGRLLLAPLQPGAAVPVDAVLGAHRAAAAGRFLVALQLVQGGEQRPRLAVTQPEQAVAAADRGLERDPRRGDPVRLGRLLGGVPAGRPGRLQRALEQAADAGRPLHRDDVPAERDQVAPEALVGEQPGRALDVPLLQSLAELGEPAVGRGQRLRHGGLLGVVSAGNTRAARPDKSKPRMSHPLAGSGGDGPPSPSLPPRWPSPARCPSLPSTALPRRPCRRR
jgi:hypothetical protein